jgi:hypothetical protein
VTSAIFPSSFFGMMLSFEGSLFGDPDDRRY